MAVDVSNSLSDTDKEVWLPVAGWEGFYEVSSFGRVRSLDRWVEYAACSRAKQHRRRYVGTVLKPKKSIRGYFRIRLCSGNTKEWGAIHRLVCEAFHGLAPSRGHVAAHNDGDQTNNAASNLRWATYKENTADRLQHGTLLFGEHNPASKLTDCDVRQIREAVNMTPKELSELYGVSRTHIHRIRKK